MSTIPECYGIWWDGITEDACKRCIKAAECLDKFVKGAFFDALAETTDTVKLSENLGVSVESIEKVQAYFDELSDEEKPVREKTEVEKLAEGGAIPPTEKITKKKILKKRKKKAKKKGTTPTIEPLSEVATSEVNPTKARIPAYAKAAKGPGEVKPKKSAKRVQGSVTRFRPESIPELDNLTNRFLRERQRNHLIGLLVPGMILLRWYKGVEHRVVVQRTRYKYNGKEWPTLRSVTTEITGRHWVNKPPKNGKPQEGKRLVCYWGPTRFFRLKALEARLLKKYS